MLRRFLGDDRGNIAILFAVASLLGSIAAAFGIDEASLYLERRQMQTLVDLAAIAAARDPANAFDIVYASLSEAGALPPSVTVEELTDEAHSTRLRVQTGGYKSDAAVAPEARFSIGGQPDNAVRVSYRFVGRLFFARAWGRDPAISVSATAAMRPAVAFSVGSRLASLSGGVANHLLNTLLGSSVQLSLVDYNGLAGARVELLSFADALANRLGITAGTYNDLLAAQADHGDIAAALAATLNGTQATAAQLIANSTGNNGSFPVAKLLNLGPIGDLAIGSGGEDLFASVGALEMLSAAAALGNGTHQAALALNLGIPGIASVALHATVGEPPQSASWLAVGNTESGVARTAQVRLRLTVDLLGSPLLLGAKLHLPIYVEVAYAEARVAAVSCPTHGAPNGAATIAARPGVVRLAIGDPTGVADFSNPAAIARATLVNALLIKVFGKSLVEIGAISPVNLPFSSTEIGAHAVKTASTQTPLQSLTSSLLGNLVLEVNGLSLGVVAGAIGILLAPVAPPIDSIVMGVLETLGVHIGEADVRVYGVTCTNPVLVG